MHVYLWLTLAFVSVGLASGCHRSGASGVEHGNVAFDISPDGDRIVFSAADGDLYLLDLKTHGVSRLTRTPATETTPSFSPDGSTILYAASEPNSDRFSLFLRSLDGNRVEQLAEDKTTSDTAPRYSGDGNSIAFVRAHRHRNYSMGGQIWDNCDVYVLSLNDRRVRRITEERYYRVIRPHFMPGDNEIVYAADIPGGGPTPALFTVSIDGNTRPKLLLRGRPLDAHVGAWASEPAVSSHLKKIAFLSDRMQPFHYDLFLADLDGTNLKPLRITAMSRYNQNPVFIPGAKRIVFLAATEWNTYSRPIFSLWQVDLDGRNVRQIAGTDLFTDSSRWTPGLKETETRPTAPAR